MRVMKTASVVALTAMAIAATLTTAANAQAIHGVQGSFDAMNAWLDGSEHADGWRDYLKTDELRQQLELGDDADVDILKEHLQRYSGGTAGLYKVRFRDVRDSLRLWIGELELPAESELGDIATKAVDNVYPINPSRLQSAQSQMESSGRSLDNFLRQGGVEKEEGWKNFLKWNDYSEALAQDPIDYPTLVRVWAITASDTPGLQYSQFANYREGLRRYLELREFFDDEDSALVNLPDRLAAYQDEPNEQTAAELGQTLGWFARTSQHSNVVKSIHRHYSKPNLFANFSERLVIHGFTQDVDENEAVNSYLNGNSTEGDAHTAASITAQLSPNGRNGEVIVSMDGNIESTTKNTAGNGATYDTTGKTTIDAEKPVLFTQRGITGQASEVKCEAEHETSNIEASSPQVEDALRQRLDNSKQQREFQAARRAEQQVKADLDSRVNERVQDANDQLEQDFFLPMMRRGVRPRALQYSSTSDRLYQFMTIAAPEHLAAPSDPPEVDLEGDVVARVHTSWLNNFADISLR